MRARIMFRIRPFQENQGDFALYYNGTFLKAGSRADLKSDIADTESKPEAHKGVFYCLPNCTECCHQHVGVSEKELFRIRRAVRQLSQDEKQRLANQTRQEPCCPLLDTEKGLCSIYDQRPQICQDFGTCTGALSCSYNLDIQLNDVHQHFKKLISDRDRDIVGFLGRDFTWEKGMGADKI